MIIPLNEKLRIRETETCCQLERPKNRKCHIQHELRLVS